MRLRRRQNIIAKQFLKKLKENFDVNQLACISQTSRDLRFRYDGRWDFRFKNCTGTYLWGWRRLEITTNNGGGDVHIRGSMYTMDCIKQFIRKQHRIKEKREKNKRFLNEFEPIQVSIEETFGSTLEIFDKLNNKS